MKRSILFTLLTCCLLSVSTLLSVKAQRSAGIGPSFKGPVGLQLYSLRDQFKTDVAGTLDKVRAMGIKYVELARTYGVAPEKFKEMLDARGLKAVSGHFARERHEGRNTTIFYGAFGRDQQRGVGPGHN